MAAPLSAARRPSVVTIGNFDGVHVGHRQLIAEAMREAAAAGWRSVALTFDRHPASVVRPETAPPLITDNEQKLELLRATGVDEVVVVSFDKARAAEPAERFARDVLTGELDARRIVVGSNFRFGHRQLGDVELLTKLGGDLGFTVSASELVSDDEDQTPVSSSRIRALIEAGDMAHAERLLGRPFELAVTVPPREQGEALEEGFAEAEPGLCMPGTGLYAVRVAQREEALGEIPVSVERDRRRLAGSAFARFPAGTRLRVQFLRRSP